MSWWRADDFCVHSALCRSLREYGNDRVYQLEDSGTSMDLWNGDDGDDGDESHTLLPIELSQSRGFEPRHG